MIIKWIFKEYGINWLKNIKDWYVKYKVYVIGEWNGTII